VYRTESLCHQNLISLEEVEEVVVGLEEEIVGEGSPVLENYYFVVVGWSWVYFFDY
jgi:hypothetical protein